MNMREGLFEGIIVKRWIVGFLALSPRTVWIYASCRVTGLWIACYFSLADSITTV